MSAAVETKQPAPELAVAPLEVVVKASEYAPTSSVGLSRSAEFKGNMSKAQSLIDVAINGKTGPERSAASTEFAELAAASGFMAFAAETDVVAQIIKGLTSNGKKDLGIRNGAVNLFADLVQAGGKAAEVTLYPAFQALNDVAGDKNKKLAEAAVMATKAFMALVDKNSSSKFAPLLFNSTTHSSGANVNRMELFNEWIQNRAGLQVQMVLTEAIPAVAKDVHDSNKDVAKSAKACLKWLLTTCPNADVTPLIPDLLVGLQDLKKIPDTVYSLASTTFIQNVDTPTLAIISPILSGGLAQSNKDAIKRACARIIENMSKLVDEPRDLAGFRPFLMPLLEKARDFVADAEVREVCTKAVNMFNKKSDLNKSLTNDINQAVTMLIMEKCAAKYTATAVADADKPIVDTVFQHVAQMLVLLNATNVYDAAEWQAAVAPYLSLLLNEADAAELTTDLLNTAEAMRVKAPEQEEEVDAEELCRCDFSLAYGNKVLLKKTQLLLHRGLKYGLMGSNDCGKTSLMRAIASQQIDGLPPPEELRTVFVETDVQGELSDLSTVDYMYADPLLKDCGVTREAMAETLRSVGFTDDSPAPITCCVGSLSGGWRMKLALARAMLLNADILLLDEPTNHLDTYNVKWLQDYLLSLKNVTVIVVSHDVKLLDHVCTNILHIEDFKLHGFKGNLSDFVVDHPEARSYFELVSTKFSFKFPAPGKIPGINSKGKALMKMNNITFTYPGAPKPQLLGVSVQVCLASRTGIVGVNGAGKSTMIKLLTGELEPDEGSGAVYKHPNCRVGYIAQHAFHHIEDHLDKTCNEYIRWRYQTGDDREALVKITAIPNEEELKQQRAKIEIKLYDPDTDTDRVVKAVIAQVFHTRQNNRKKNIDEFECQFEGSTNRVWIDRKTLCDNGWKKLVQQVDERIALRETMFARPLTLKNVVAHMADIGLEEEFSTHMKIGALSTGQKVKVVLGAALWNQPHILILDEPTNYLDRDSLGALAGAIREFEGGVIMISHNSQFVDTLCPQIWHLENNTLNVKGDADWMRDALKEKISDKEEAVGEMEDKFGNVVKVKAAKKKTMTNKERREKERRRKNAIKNGLEVSDDDDY